MKHLTLSDRIRIEALLEERKSFSQIAAEIGRSTTTISREVRRHRSVVHHYSTEMARKRSECQSIPQRERPPVQLVSPGGYLGPQTGGEPQKRAPAGQTGRARAGVREPQDGV